MSLKLFMCISISLLLLGCVPSTKQESEESSQEALARQTITEWMGSSDDYPQYTPMGFGALTPRYERTDRSIQLATLIMEEETADAVNTAKLDSLRNLLERSKGPLLGYIILHQYQTTSIAGEVTKHESLFFLDSTLRVGAVLDPEAFDLILDEKIIYRHED